jgi:hypothetical protein
MQHVSLAAVKGRRVTQDEATVLRLPASRSVPGLEDWQRVLFQAADILDHFGWCRNSLERGPRYCVIGAIVAANTKGEVPKEYGAEKLLLQEPAFRCLIGKVQRYPSHPELMHWNDKIAKSGKQVAATLRAAAGRK